MDELSDRSTDIGGIYCDVIWQLTNPIELYGNIPISTTFSVIANGRTPFPIPMEIPAGMCLQQNRRGTSIQPRGIPLLQLGIQLATAYPVILVAVGVSVLLYYSSEPVQLAVDEFTGEVQAFFEECGSKREVRGNGPSLTETIVLIFDADITDPAAAGIQANQTPMVEINLNISPSDFPNPFLSSGANLIQPFYL